jgi:mRNA interferase MazF
MPSTTSFSPGDVVLALFTFTDGSGAKQRPAVIVSSRGFHARRPDAVLLALTSQGPLPGDVVLVDWGAAGLPKPSFLKPVIQTVERDVIAKRLGSLSAADFGKAQACLRAMLEV